MKNTGYGKHSLIYLLLAAVVLFFAVSGLLGIQGCSGSSGADNGTDSETLYLARVEVPNYIQDINLSIHGTLVDGDGVYFALVVATMDELLNSGVKYRLIDEYDDEDGYLLAEAEKPEIHQQAGRICKILYDDNHWIITKFDPDVAEALAGIGFDLKLMSEDPIIFTPEDADEDIDWEYDDEDTDRKRAGFVTDNTVKEMIDKILENDIRTYIAGLSGVNPVEIDDENYTIKTRHTQSGKPVNMATEYVYEQLNGYGNLKASFQNWQRKIDTESGNVTYKCRNVVVELKGKTKPDEIIILIAHIDSINDEGEINDRAPGADDNASGCAAMMAISKAMSSYSFERTVRFVFATGEEQGTLGSEQYVKTLDGQKIIAVINLDMISFNTQKSLPIHNVKTRRPEDKTGNKADMALANVYMKVAKGYGIDKFVTPSIKQDGDVNGDQSSFWDDGYASIWIIEDDYDNFNEDNMHSTSDKLSTLNLPYCTYLVKATIGTTAHLAKPVK